jgi:methionyl-tRNA synthetase
VLTLDPLIDCDFRTMHLIELSPVEGSDRFLALTLEFEGDRLQVVAGLGQQEDRSDMVGQDLLVLANIEPRALSGHESRGMILASKVNDEPILLVVPHSQTNAIME